MAKAATTTKRAAPAKPTALPTKPVVITKTKTQGAKPVELHGVFLSGPSYKVALGLSLLGQPFVFHHVDLRAGAHKAPAYLALNRYGQVPCLVDGKLKLNQSASILLYLAEKTGKMGGKSDAERAQVREWMFWAFDRLNPNIFRPRAVRRGIRQLPEIVVEEYVGLGKQALDVLESHLATRDWLVGSAITMADVDLYGVARYAEEAGFDLSKHPGILAWRKRLEARKGWATPEALMPAPA